MRNKILLRIAAVMTVVQSAAHTIGGVFGPIEPGNPATAVAAMKANPFNAMGNTRTYWDFFIGLGLCVTVFLVLEAGLLWIISDAINENRENWRAILFLLLVCNLAIALLGIRYFFLATVTGPAVNFICIGLVLAGRRFGMAEGLRKK